MRARGNGVCGAFSMAKVEMERFKDVDCSIEAGIEFIPVSATFVFTDLYAVRTYGLVMVMLKLRKYFRRCYVFENISFAFP